MGSSQEPFYVDTSKCPYLTSVEDRNVGTNYPHCTCGMAYCDRYKGFCGVRDGD